MTSDVRASAIERAKPRGHAVEDVIAIDASPGTVWALLADVAGWGGWNPVYPDARGSIVPGGTLALTILLPGSKPRRSRATVYEAVPGRALRFGAPALFGLLHATRSILIHPAASGGCVVVNGEAFSRPLAWPLVRALGETIREGLRRQNEGLKAAAEARPGLDPHVTDASTGSSG